MTISAKIIADSLGYGAPRLTTMELRYPRFIHAEFMTHRVFSRNASSSRAIPVERLIQDVLDDTAMPIHWGKNQAGMQARVEHDAPVVFRNDAVPPDLAWTRARDVAISAAERFAAAGYHKQIVNRLLEPFSHINVVVSATEWSNFFALRDHPDAQPEIQALARTMREAMEHSTPKYVSAEEIGWHLPYVLDEEKSLYRPDVLTKVSAARCARVSYKTHDGKPAEIAKDLELFDRLAKADPPHLSPLEHVCKPTCVTNSNLKGWTQLRKEYER
jgi:hypothetical protein